MPDNSNFTPEEWKLLLESVMMAGIAVSAAEPSGLWGLLKENVTPDTGGDDNPGRLSRLNSFMNF